MEELKLCPEMEKLRKLLNKNNISWCDASENCKFIADYWTERTRFKYNGHIFSAIHGYGSHGGLRFHKKVDPGLIELLIDDDKMEGFLRAEEVIIKVMNCC